MVDEIKQDVQAQPDLVVQATQAAERIEKALLETKEILAKNQAIEARIILGGQSHAGTPTPVVEETPAQYRERIMRGGK
jgi:hypothetical protein